MVMCISQQVLWCAPSHSRNGEPTKCPGNGLARASLSLQQDLSDPGNVTELLGSAHLGI